jgi:hypothetical protein
LFTNWLVKLAEGSPVTAFKGTRIAEGLRLIAAGGVLGIGAALVTSKLLKSLLFNVGPRAADVQLDEDAIEHRTPVPREGTRSQSPRRLVWTNPPSMSASAIRQSKCGNGPEGRLPRLICLITRQSAGFSRTSLLAPIYLFILRVKSMARVFE